MPPAATMGDNVVGSCTHVYASTTPSPGGPVPTPVPLTLPFSAAITSGCATNVMIGGKPAAVIGCTAIQSAVHPPMAGATIPGPPTPPTTNQAIVMKGSATVLIGGKPAVRMGDMAQGTGCLVAPGNVIGTAVTVMIGG